MFAEGNAWHTWIRDYRYGMLAVLPKGEIGSVCDNLRLQYDPLSAKSFAAHITVTQPFAAPPSTTDIGMIKALLEAAHAFICTIGPVCSSPNGRLIWLDVSPRDKVIQLREKLHKLGHFRTDLPLTKGFIPHLTISETPRAAKEVESINRRLNSKFAPQDILIDRIQWIVPNEAFQFTEFMTLKLGS